MFLLCYRHLFGRFWFVRLREPPLGYLFLGDGRVGLYLLSRGHLPGSDRIHLTLPELRGGNLLRCLCRERLRKLCLRLLPGFDRLLSLLLLRRGDVLAAGRNEMLGLRLGPLLPHICLGQLCGLRCGHLLGWGIGRGIGTRRLGVLAVHRGHLPVRNWVVELRLVPRGPVFKKWHGVVCFKLPTRILRDFSPFNLHNVRCGRSSIEQWVK